MRYAEIGIIGVIVLIFAGCGTISTSNSTTCRADINDVVTEASTSGPITYECGTHEYSLVDGVSVRVLNVVGSVTASSPDRNLSIESDAKTGKEHRRASMAGSRADCTDTYISELPVDVGTASEIKNTVENWSKRWQRDETRSDCPQWIRDLDPDGFDTVLRKYIVTTDSGSAEISIKRYIRI